MHISGSLDLDWIVNARTVVRARGYGIALDVTLDLTGRGSRFGWSRPRFTRGRDRHMATVHAGPVFIGSLFGRQ